jgi:hypothetical protein
VLELYRSIEDVGAAGEALASASRPLDRPALVLWGRHDPYLGVAEAERQRAAFPSADVRVLDESGHWPFADAPAAVEAAVLGHLARHAPLAAPAGEMAALTAGRRRVPRRRSDDDQAAASVSARFVRTRARWRL